MAESSPNVVVLRDAARACWLRFSDPVEILSASCTAEVPAVLARLDEATCRQGLHAAGFLSYEAAPAFDADLAVRAAGPVPLAWFGLYRGPECLPHLRDMDEVEPGPSTGTPTMEREAYLRAVERIRDYIAAGDTYQVNFTYRLRSAFSGHPGRFFARTAAAHRPPYAAFVDAGRFVVCSFSPELFFRLDGDLLSSRPMKGTAPRGRTLEEDRERAGRLARSEKDRAENIMIVDMMRNDMGRVAIPGSVEVPELFRVEKYPTVWQLTSTVTARTSAGVPEILRALFPCASITGAPKRRTMQIIAELETTPRGVYTGCVGFVSPGRRAQFNVAIRTLVIDAGRGDAEYGIGGGIVWDSTGESEFAECATKARLLDYPSLPFCLLETMRWSADGGYSMLEEHLQRLKGAAEYFAYPLDDEEIRQCLARLAAGLSGAAKRVRLLVHADGRAEAEASELAVPMAKRPVVCLAPSPIDETNPFLFHKTTNRRVYEDARASRPGFDDVLLWNSRGELTESCVANVVVEIEGELFTPPVSSGLLAGTLRAQLLREGRVRERVVLVDELPACSRIWLVNSVRGMWEVERG